MLVFNNSELVKNLKEYESEFAEKGAFLQGDTALAIKIKLKGYYPTSKGNSNKVELRSSTSGHTIIVVKGLDSNYTIDGN